MTYSRLRVFIVLAFVSMACGGFASTVRADILSMPMHGAWCGPNHPSNALEMSYAPIDPLDNACRNHDVCYAARGTGNCGCDVAFMEALASMRYPTPALEEKARAMYDAIGLMPCSDPVGMAYKQSCVWNALAHDTINGRQAPWQMPLRFGKLGLTVMENKLRRGW